jgi:hypothetical protein
MNELFPFVGGFLAGIVASWLPRRQARCGWSIAIGSVVGGVATLASGEYRFGWHFVLIDTALVIGTALSVSARMQAIVVKNRVSRGNHLANNVRWSFITESVRRLETRLTVSHHG